MRKIDRERDRRRGDRDDEREKERIDAGISEREKVG